MFFVVNNVGLFSVITAKIDKIFFNSKAFVLFYIESFLNKRNKCHF